MRVKYFYNWGYFYPITCGADQVAVNHFTYFRERGWSVDLILVDDPRRRASAGRFREKYPWLNSLTEAPLQITPWGFRELLFAFEHLARARRLREALARPADFFFTNYVFTSPLLDYVPRSCKRVLETVDLMTRQFAIAERAALPLGAPPDPLARAREDLWLRIELEMYQFFDAAVMINPDELTLARSRGVNNTYYVPQMYDVAPAAGDPGDDFEFDLIFVGSDAPINVRGMSWFYHHVYVPYLWRHGVRLAVVGNVCRPLGFRDAYVTLLSRVEGSLDHLYAASKLVIVPIFEGTGLSTKTLEGLANGRALVVAPMGARGLDDRAGAYVKLDMKADPKGTAQVILDLLADPARREELRRAGLAYVRRHFSREAFFAGLDEVIESVGLGPSGVRRLRDGDSPLAAPEFDPAIAGRIGPLANAG